MKLLMLCVMLMTSIAQAQTYTDNPIVQELLEKVRREYVENGVPETEFLKLDSVVIKKDLPFPVVGFWKRSNGRHVIYLHPYALRHPFATEYTIKHEVGHAHGMEHTKNGDDIMCEDHLPPDNMMMLDQMTREYFAALKAVSVE